MSVLQNSAIVVDDAVARCARPPPGRTRSSSVAPRARAPSSNRNREKEIGNVAHRRHRRLDLCRGGAPRARVSMNSVVNAAVSVLGEPGVVEPDPLARQRPVDVDGERDRLHLRQRIGEKEVGAAPVGPSHALLAPSSREVVSSLAVLCLGPTADICKGALDHDFPEFLWPFSFRGRSGQIQPVGLFGGGLEAERYVYHSKRSDSLLEIRILHLTQRTEPGIDGLARTNLRFS